MSEIKKGDLVMVVFPASCCGSTKAIGEVFTASDDGPKTWCRYCKKPHSERTVYIDSTKEAARVSRLIKIDPPSTGEYDRVPVRMKEPA